MTSDQLRLFSNQDIKQLILPLIAEQFLLMALGIVDTVMVASVGEAAISSISLVNIMANLILQLLSALCTGGAVVVSQYLGRKDYDNACKAAAQLMMMAIVMMTALTLVFIAFRTSILQLAFGDIEADVMENAQVYWLITAFSFPFLAAYSAAVAVFRSMGNSKAALHISVFMNVIHLILNAALIYGCRMGVAGAAISTLISRVLAAVIALYILRHSLPVFIEDYRKIRPDFAMLKNIFRIGIPNGIENGLFNVGKLIVQSLIAGLGTAALAANAVLNSISSVVIVPGSAMSLAMITVVGQCVGAADYDQAQYYIKKIMKITFVCMALTNLPLLFLGGPVVKLFGLGAEASVIVGHLLPIILLMDTFLWPMSFAFPNALRAAGDVRVTMIISFASMWLIRTALSYLFVKGFSMGVAGVWYSMFLDWGVRNLLFILRYRGGKWKTMNKMA